MRTQKMLTYQDFKKACEFAVEKLGVEEVKQMSWFGQWGIEKAKAEAVYKEKAAA